LWGGGAPGGARACDNPIDKNLELGRKMRIDGTPTTFLASGQRVIGARFSDVRAGLDEAAK
jgi:thiol:disulfide interchange protein DsbC